MLVTAARDAGYALPRFFEECKVLNDYAIDVRYPENVPIPDEATGRRVLAAAQRIIDAAKRASESGPTLLTARTRGL